MAPEDEWKPTTDPVVTSEPTPTWPFWTLIGITTVLLIVALIGA